MSVVRLLMIALVAVGQLAWLAAAVAQPVPLTPELQVNTYTTNAQASPAVAADAAGDFVVVWTSTGSAASDTSNESVQGQRYDSSGTAVGSQFQVNTYTTAAQARPAVARDPAGNFVVVWESEGSVGSDTDLESIQCQRYDAAGAPQGAQFQVNTYTTGYQDYPSVAMDGLGNFVVVWRSAGSGGSDTSTSSIQGQRFNATGATVGSEFQVNAYTTSFQYEPNVAVAGAGNFVVVWTSAYSSGSDTSFGTIQGQRYDAAGAPAGAQFQVNTYTPYFQQQPGVAVDAAGGFVVMWTSPKDFFFDADIHGQRYDAAGAPVASEFQANSYTPSLQAQPGIVLDAVGNFTVVWTSDGSDENDTDSFSIQRRTFAPIGLMPGRSVIAKQGLAKFVAKPDPGNMFPLPSPNAVASGGSLRVFDVDAGAGDDTYNLLPGGGWKGLGNPAGSKGWKYKGAGTTGDPCRVVLFKTNLIKAVCKGSGVTLVPPFSGDAGIVLSLGTTDRYCAQFGGDEVKNDATLTKRKNAPAPGACP